MAFEPMNADGWKCRIERPIYNQGFDLFLYRFRDGHIEILQPDGTIKLHQEGQARTEDVKPFLSARIYEARSLLYALAEGLEAEGIKTSNDFKAQGLLEATREHLADLRQLLKLKDKAAGK